jgi:hypothetical protein
MFSAYFFYYLMEVLCDCGGRRILVFPKGNNVDHLSMYLDVADSTNLPYGWSRYAQFSLTVINQLHQKYSIRKGIVPLLVHLNCPFLLRNLFINILALRVSWLFHTTFVGACFCVITQYYFSFSKLVSSMEHNLLSVFWLTNQFAPNLSLYKASFN